MLQCGGCAAAGTTPQLNAALLAPPNEYCCAYGAGAYFAGPGGRAVPSAAAEL